MNGVTALCALLRLLPERDSHDELFELADAVVERLDSPAGAFALMARFELAMLGALGFGLDLRACALTGARGFGLYQRLRSLTDMGPVSHSD